MQWRNSADRYGAVVQGSHWLAVLLIVFAWLLGQFMDDIPQGPARAAGHWLHNSAGSRTALGSSCMWRSIC